MTYDIIIVGGGINGSAIAREAALNGLKVILVEKDDLAAHTSSQSTKLIHGGLRYLEYYKFQLVREALLERERLLACAPHLIYPMTFVLPHEHAVRPWWLVRLGLLLYDTIGGRISLKRSRSLRASDTLFRAPLKRADKGFVYSDAWVDDARLVVLNCMDAARHGADICTRTALIHAVRSNDIWDVTLSDGRCISARKLVNAAGPWVSDALAKTGTNTKAHVRLVKGSHIVVPALFEGNHAYMLQQPDRRIVFAIAYQGDKTLIGTTDIAVQCPEDARISSDEISYLCDASNRYFTHMISANDVIATYSGVRPLYDDGSKDAKAVTRDYVLELDDNGPALLSVFGGKITTARHLAEDAMGWLGHPSTATRKAPLPGGEINNFEAFLTSIRHRFPMLSDQQSERMARAYGTLLIEMMDNHAFGEDFGHGLMACEVNWMIDHEWARTTDDILWRRSKLGLLFNSDQVSHLTRYVETKIGTIANRH